MRKSQSLVLLHCFLLAALGLGAPCLTPDAPQYNVDLSKVTISWQTMAPFSGTGDNGDTINDVFFLGRYGKDQPLHLFCREVDAANGTPLDVDLGCVEGVLSDAPLYVWPNDPKTNNYALKMQVNPNFTSHYPVRYVTNLAPGAANPANMRAVVWGYGSGASGVYIKEQK
jgi:hypothetical protein